jgi:hypothetical protein
MEPRATDRYEVQWAKRNEGERFIDALVHIFDYRVWNSAVVTIRVRDGDEVARMTVTGESGQAMFDRVRQDLIALSAEDFEREWGISPGTP